MSFKQFQENPHICGGYTATRAVRQDDLDVWAKVLALPGTGAELIAKGTQRQCKLRSSPASSSDSLSRMTAR